MKESKIRKKLIKHLNKAGKLVHVKNRAVFSESMHIVAYKTGQSDGYGIEVNHNFDSGKDLLKILAISLYKEAENRGLNAQEIWDAVIEDEDVVRNGAPLH